MTNLPTLTLSPLGLSDLFFNYIHEHYDACFGIDNVPSSDEREELKKDAIRFLESYFDEEERVDDLSQKLVEDFLKRL